jgi:hypothetical protein
MMPCSFSAWRRSAPLRCYAWIKYKSQSAPCCPGHE